MTALGFYYLHVTAIEYKFCYIYSKYSLNRIQLCYETMDLLSETQEA